MLITIRGVYICGIVFVWFWLPRVARLMIHTPIAISMVVLWSMVFFFQAEDGIRDVAVTGVQTCALPISVARRRRELSLVSGALQPGARRPGTDHALVRGLYRYRRSQADRGPDAQRDDRAARRPGPRLDVRGDRRLIVRAANRPGAGGEGCTDGLDGAHPGRDRDRERAARPRRSQAVASRERGMHRRELRGHSAVARRLRAVRAREGRVYRRGAAPPRPLRGRGWRHDLLG